MFCYTLQKLVENCVNNLRCVLEYMYFTYCQLHNTVMTTIQLIMQILLNDYSKRDVDYSEQPCFCSMKHLKYCELQLTCSESLQISLL